MNQPIILKRNNTPTKAGNYLGAASDRNVIAFGVFPDEGGDLCIMDGDGGESSIIYFEWWSDEITNIEFEESEPVQDHIPDVTKRVSERLLQGTFEHEGKRFEVVDVGEHDKFQPYMVLPAITTTAFGLSRWQNRRSLEEHGVEIHWHDEPQTVDGKEQFVHGYRVGHYAGGTNRETLLETEITELAFEAWHKIHEPEPQPIEIEPGQKWKDTNTGLSWTVMRLANHDQWYLGTCFNTLADMQGTTSKSDLQAWLNEHADFVPEETA